MTERERLVELLEEAGSEWNSYIEKCFVENEVPQKTYDELHADYLLQNGIIAPSCKVGDTVYAFEDCFGVVLPFMVEQIIITYGEKEPLVEYCANCHDNERDELLADLDFEPEDIGVTVFLTEEEAKKSLKDVQK